MRTLQQPPNMLGHGPVAECPFPTVTSAFYHHVQANPQNAAIRDLSKAAPKTFTYLELAQKVQALAAHLHAQGVEKDQRVPLVVKRGWEMVVGILAILSCGAQYVPLDGGVVPDSTIRHVFNQSGGTVVLCLQSTACRVQSLCPEARCIELDQAILTMSSSEYGVSNTIDLATQEGGCYVIYTSGEYIITGAGIG